jgi:CDP-paratose 2-epimerase
MAVIITGSAGLIGSEAVSFFSAKGHDVIGIDNDMRSVFFGEDASTDWNRRRLLEAHPSYRHHCLDIRDSKGIEALFQANEVELVIHSAAQPSHDLKTERLARQMAENTRGSSWDERVSAVERRLTALERDQDQP